MNKSSTLIDASSPVEAPADKERERQEAIVRIQKLIDEGFASGISTRSMDDILHEARRRASVT